MDLQQAAGLTIVFLVIGLLIGLAIAAVILRAACALFNKMAGGAGSPGSVPSPGFGKAMLMVLVIGIIQFVTGIVMGVVGVVTPDMGLVTTNLISAPISFLVSAGMISAMLPTSFGKGLGVALCQFIIMVLIIVILVVIFVVIGAAMFAG